MSMAKLFGQTKKPDPKEQVREWKKKINRECRGLDRQIRKIETDEFKIKQTIKQHAKAGNMDSARVLAKSLVKSEKAKLRLHVTKAQMNSVAMTMQEQVSMLRQTSALAKSSRVMAAMNSVVCIPEIQATMQELSTEMMKAGLIEEMTEDALSVLDDPDLDEEADEEVNKVLDELIGDKLNPLKVAENELPEQEEVPVEDDAVTDDLTARLKALAE